jgi:hypothetical protein
MISSEVQRTLVKSPPELWTELSDPGSLARHLDEFGEIRITRVEPERTVEWEADGATGTVLIKPSGWGTRVTLTATRELPEAESPPISEAVAEPQPPADASEPQPPVDAVVEPAAGDAEDQPLVATEDDWTTDADLVSEPESEPPLAGEAEQWEDAEWEYEPEPEPEPEPESEPRRGFLARLFGRRRRQALEPAPLPVDPDPDAEADAQAEAEAAAIPEDLDGYEALGSGADTIEWPAEEAVEAAPESPPAAVAPGEDAAGQQPVAQDCDGEAATLEEPIECEQPSDPSADLQAAEEIVAEEVTAVLTSMLDRLGTAHHRPFSRA